MLTILCSLLKIMASYTMLTILCSLLKIMTDQAYHQLSKIRSVYKISYEWLQVSESKYRAIIVSDHNIICFLLGYGIHLALSLAVPMLLIGQVSMKHVQ